MDFDPRSSKSFEVERASRDGLADRRVGSCLQRQAAATRSANSVDEDKGQCAIPHPRCMDEHEGRRDESDDMVSSEISDSSTEQDGGGGRPSSKLPTLRYTVTDVPPWHVCIILGFQHYLTMLGATIVIPALLVPAMGGTPKDHARVVQTIFFVSGLNTLIQTTIGDRLPIVQGGSFSFLRPAFSIIAIIEATMSFPTEHDRFVYTMRELQGSIIGSSIVVMAIGYTGAMGALLRFLSPIVVAPTVCMVGLSLYSAGFSGVAQCFEQGLLSILAVIVFSQVLKHVEVPIPSWIAYSLGVTRAPRSPSLLGGGAGGSGDLVSTSSSAEVGRPWSPRRRRRGGGGGGGAAAGGGVRIFELFPLLWSIMLSWAVAGILTAAGAYNNTSAGRQKSCRTDQLDAVHDAPWFYVPYPLQWGTPIFRPASIITMLAGALAAMIESTGDYYACARMCGAPVPPPYVISRGIGAEGMGCLMCGLFGTGNGTTSYAENIGAIGLTGVGSRRVVQAGAAFMLFLATFGKFGGLFASLPPAIVSGLFCCVFGLIAAVGLSNLQFTDQNSGRNLFIVGFAIYMALSVPDYFNTFAAAHNGAGPIATSSTAFNDIANTLFSTSMCVALICAFTLDNLISGTPEERGLTHWSTLAASKSSPAVPTAAAATGRGGGGSGGGGRAAAVKGSSDSESDSDEKDPALNPRNNPRIKAVYDLPYFLQALNERYILPHRLSMYRAMRRLIRAARRAWRRALRRMRACRGSPNPALTEGLRHNGSVRLPASAADIAADASAGGRDGGAAVPYGDIADRPRFVIDEETGPDLLPRDRSMACQGGNIGPGASGGDSGGGLFPGSNGVLAGGGGGQ